MENTSMLNSGIHGSIDPLFLFGSFEQFVEELLYDNQMPDSSSDLIIQSDKEMWGSGEKFTLILKNAKIRERYHNLFKVDKLNLEITIHYHSYFDAYNLPVHTVIANLKIEIGDAKFLVNSDSISTAGKFCIFYRSQEICRNINNQPMSNHAPLTFQGFFKKRV